MKTDMKKLAVGCYTVYVPLGTPCEEYLDYLKIRTRTGSLWVISQQKTQRLLVNINDADETTQFSMDFGSNISDLTVTFPVGSVKLEGSVGDRTRARLLACI